MANKYAQFYALVKELNNKGANVTKEDIVSGYTKGKTESLSSLNSDEYKGIIAMLSNFKPKEEKQAIIDTYNADPLNDTRKAIISQFKSIGSDTQAAIDWAENQGVNGVKKKFNEYNGQELYKLLLIAQKVRKDKIKSFVNRF
jgi:hypothetical protein